MSEIIKMAALTMSSREIADLTGKRHDHVLRDVRVLKDQLGEMFGGSPQTWVHPQNGQKYEEFVLDKDTCLTLLLGYDAVARMKVVKRWQELESGAVALPQTLPEALRLAAEAIEERDRLALENKAKDEALAEAAPKVRALDRIASPTEGAVCLRVAAKLLQMPEKQFFQFANAEGYIFRHHHSRVWQGYAEKAKAGLVEQKFTTVTRDDGSEKTVEQVLITRLGIAKLAEKLERKRACEHLTSLTASTVGQSRLSTMQP